MSALFAGLGKYWSEVLYQSDCSNYDSFYVGCESVPTGSLYRMCKTRDRVPIGSSGTIYRDDVRCIAVDTGNHVPGDEHNSLSLYPLSAMGDMTM